MILGVDPIVTPRCAIASPAYFKAEDDVFTSGQTTRTCNRRTRRRLLRTGWRIARPRGSRPRGARSLRPWPRARPPGRTPRRGLMLRPRPRRPALHGIGHRRGRAQRRPRAVAGAPAHRPDGLPHRGNADPQEAGQHGRRARAGLQPDAARPDRGACRGRAGPHHGRDPVAGHDAGGAGRRRAASAGARGQGSELVADRRRGRAGGLVRVFAFRGLAAGRHRHPVLGRHPRLRRHHLPQGLDRRAQRQPQHQRADEHRRDRRGADRPVARGGHGDVPFQCGRADRSPLAGPCAPRHPRPARPGAGNRHGAPGGRRLGGSAGRQPARGRRGAGAAGRTHRGRRRHRQRQFSRGPIAHYG
ncbi:hypothetical protein FQZ97_656100 [compost metagenome]